LVLVEPQEAVAEAVLVGTLRSQQLLPQVAAEAAETLLGKPLALQADLAVAAVEMARQQ
jgi:hypothetical protein